MAQIVPTITTDQPAIFTENIAKFSQFARRIQIDASDGTFAPNNLVPIAGVSLPPGVVFDLHMMTARPSEHLASIIAMHPSLCIFHAEVDDDLSAVFSQLRAAGIKVGIALLQSTYPGKVRQWIAEADHAMVFAGQLGSQGAEIDLLQTEKVTLLKQIKPDLEIGWDGGANLSNVRALAHAGVDVINVGGAISKASDPAAMYQSLVAEADKNGVLL